jgi:hypothetical protein
VDDANNSLQYFFPFDHGHVYEKVLQWYDDWASHNQDGYLGRVSSTAAELRVHESLISRLARANIRRRKQLQYWLRHADTARDAPTIDPLEVRVQKPVDAALSATEGVPIADMPEDFVPKSEAPLTEKTKKSFSTTVKSEIRDSQYVEVPACTEYEQSVLGKFKSTKVPQLPAIALRFKKFKCPYCGLVLESDMMRSRRVWKYVFHRSIRSAFALLIVFIEGPTYLKIYGHMFVRSRSVPVPVGFITHVTTGYTMRLRCIDANGCVLTVANNLLRVGQLLLGIYRAAMVTRSEKHKSL